MDRQDPTQGLADIAGLLEEPRPTLTSLTVHDAEDLDSDEVHVEVTLSWGRDWSSGHYRGPATGDDLIDAAAAATLDALHGLLPDAVRFQLRWVGLVLADDPDAHRIVNVLVSLEEDTGNEVYVGSALARNDARVAAVRATLDGINRRLMHLMTG